MERETVKISSLKAAPYNPRRISKEASEGLAKSLERWGVVQEVVANRRTGHIVGGHQRVAALRKMGVKEVPVVWVDLDDVEEKALNVALNNPHISGEFDDSIASLLAEIKDGIGPHDFAELKLDDLLPPDAAVVEGKTEPDDVPEAPEEPITKPGDLWVLGDHRLLCGDSTNVQHVERLMDGAKIDFCFTSPPYNAETKVGFGGSGLKNVDLYLDNSTDKRTSDDYIQFSADVVSALLAHASHCFSLCWNVGYNKRSPSDYLLAAAKINSLIPLAETVVWQKQLAISLRGDNLTRICEFVFVFALNSLKLNKQHSDCEKNLWQISNVGANLENHKACFPVALPEKAINLFAPNGAIVAEPFGGSGSTLIACEKTSRHCRMMELDPAYCDVIVKRWEDFTGKKAVLEANDATG